MGTEPVTRTGDRPARTPHDTPDEVTRRHTAVLRALGLSGRAQLAFSLMDDAMTLARAGIRAREPGVSPDRERWLLVARRYGRATAVQVLGPEPPRDEHVRAEPVRGEPTGPA